MMAFTSVRFRFVLLTGIIVVVSHQALFNRRDENTLKATVPVDIITAKKVDLNTTKAIERVPIEFTTKEVNLNTTAHQQQQQNSNQTTSSLLFTPNSKILTFHRLKWRDRMGSRLQPALGAWALAQYWKNDTVFCLPAAEAMALMFPRCPGTPKRMATKFNLTTFNFMDTTTTPPESTPGLHVLHPTRSNPWALIESYERKLPSSVWSTAVRQKWASMITRSFSNNNPQAERLWKKDNSTIHVAVHVRRGDIRSDNKYHYAFISDSEILEALKYTKAHIQRILKKKKQHNMTTIQVHLFSEDYGQTNNWTAYQNHVDHFHLAPEGGETIERNLRDWTHFVEADVLLVGGTFSAIPALGRLYSTNKDTTTTIFPLTVYFPRVQKCFGHSSFWPEGWYLWAGNHTFEKSAMIA